MIKIIKENRIKTIINLRGKWDEQWYKREKAITEEHNVRLYDVKISPHDLPDFQQLTAILNILLNGERPLLIHCNKGVDRTGLVSAIALMIEQNPPLSIVKNQFSVRYGVFPFYRSVGPYFFGIYEKWLNASNKAHSMDNFLLWADNEYVDSKGNLLYWVDAVNDRMFIKKKVLMIEDSSGELYLRGWAVNMSKKSPIDGELYIVFDNKMSQKADFKYNRPDVARHFKFEGKQYKNFFVGWDAAFKRDDFSDGCHKIYFKFIKNESTIWKIPTRFEFCL